MTAYEEAMNLADELIDGSETLEPEVLVVKVSKLAAILENMRLLDANNIMKYMKELVVNTVGDEKRKELIKKYL